MTKGKTILAVLAGVAAGAALGILFAPDKGTDTRKKISKSGEDLADAVNDKINQKFEELLAMITGKSKKSVAQNDSPVSKREMVD